MMNKVTEIAPIAPFLIRVRFNDGCSGVHDCVADIQGDGPIMSVLRDPACFAKVSLDQGAPTWPNGFDMCPDWLKIEMAEAGELTPLSTE